MPMLHRIKLLLCSALMPLLVACAASTPFKPSEQTPLPDVRIGEQINLLPVNVVRDKVAAVSAPGGQIHVLIAVTELREVHEVVVSPRGVVARRVVRRNISPWSIVAAFDAVGLLHLMLDDLHLIYSDGNWRAEEQNPWQRLKLEAASPQMVPGGSQLYWYFLVKGEEFGAPTRMELYGFGSYGAGILWPSFTQGVKTVLVKDPPDPDGPLLVLDPAGKMDSHVAGAANDKPLSEEERALCRALGRRLAWVATRLATPEGERR